MRTIPLPGEYSRQYSRQQQDQYNYHQQQPDDDDLSSFGSWTDTGDIGDQHGGDDDPVRKHLEEQEALDDQILVGVLKRQQERQHNRARSGSASPSSGSRSSSQDRASLRKDRIRIPTVVHREVPWAQRLLAAFIMGRSKGIHGLTGKPLLLVEPVDPFFLQCADV